jgi:hypothetical protein
MKHVCNFYIYRVIKDIDRTPVVLEEVMLDGTSGVRNEDRRSLEQLICDSVARAHNHYFNGKYAQALGAYAAAYTLVYDYLRPDLSVSAATQVKEKLSNLNVLESLLASSAKVAQHESGHMLNNAAFGSSKRPGSSKATGATPPRSNWPRATCPPAHAGRSPTEPEPDRPRSRCVAPDRLAIESLGSSTCWEVAWWSTGN